MLSLSVLFFFTNEHNVLTVLLLYYRGMLYKEKNDAKNPAILSFCFAIERTQLNAVYA